MPMVLSINRPLTGLSSLYFATYETQTPIMSNLTISPIGTAIPTPAINEFMFDLSVIGNSSK